MEFMNIQIPYRGGIPILNRRGPIANLELDIETIKTLISYGIEILNPENGKPVTFESAKEPVVAQVVEEQSVATTVKEKAPKPEETAPASTDTEKKPEAVEQPAEEVTPAPSTEKVDTEAPATQDASDSASEDADDVIEGADAFDYTKIANYSALSKSKRKELRKYFAEKNGKMDINILYATLNTMAKK